MSLIKKAKRSQTYLKIGMSGISGSGKTYSSLLFAKGFMGDLSKVCVLDCENESANLYEDLGDYSVLPFAPPFHPDRYVKAIDYIVNQGFEFIIIDSTSHEWDGEGGCLDIHSKMDGNSFANWSKITPLHKKFIDAILQSKAHVICTMRKKSDYVLEENSKGKQVPKKVGLKDIQRDGFEYELTLNFEINQDHLASVTKDRTGLFLSHLPFVIDEKTGKLVRDWNEGKVTASSKIGFSGDKVSQKGEAPASV